MVMIVLSSETTLKVFDEVSWREDEYSYLRYGDELRGPRIIQRKAT